MTPYKLIIVQVVLVPDAVPDAQKAFFVAVPTMRIQQIRIIKMLTTEGAVGMCFSHMLSVLFRIVQFVLVRKDFLVAAAKVA